MAWVEKQSIGFSAYRTVANGPLLRNASKWVADRTELLGFPPDKIGVRAPGFGTKLLDYPRAQGRLGRLDFAKVESLSLLRLRADWEYTVSDWSWHWSMSPQRGLPRSEWTCCWVVIPEECHISEADAITLLCDSAKLTVQSYGYLYAIGNNAGAAGYGLNVGYGKADSQEETENAGWWGNLAPAVAQHTLLRDVHTTNFLSRRYLDLPVESLTLERWIRSDDRRGSLQPLTDMIWQWTPPPEQIPSIRERLFRAGVLFYYRFFQHWVPDNAWKRDFSRPFACPDDIPEIFRSTYRRVIDPATDRRWTR